MSKLIFDGQTRHKPLELLRLNAGGDLSIQAKEMGMSLSAFLEKADPSSEWNDGTDAFTRQMIAAGIRTKSDPVQGVMADTFGAFDSKEGRPLAIEFIRRRKAEARYGRPANPYGGQLVQVEGRSFYTSSDDALNTIARPYADAAGVRSSRLSSALSLSDITAQTTAIDNNSYRAAYMDEPTESELSKKRVGEGADIPLAKIRSGQHTVELYKYGIGWDITNEALRRTRIDKLAFFVQRATIWEENQKVEEGIDTLVNGDGNTNAATEYDSSDLDASLTTGGVSVLALLAFKMKFANDYTPDIFITDETTKLLLLTLDFGTGNIPYTVLAPRFGGFTEVNSRVTDGVRLAVSPAVTPGTVVAIDTSSALEHVVEVGSDITETAHFARNQTNVITMTENEGFAVLDQKATRVWDTNE